MEKEALLITPDMIKPSSKGLKVIGTINPAAIRREDGKIILYVRVIEQLKVLEDEKYCYSPRMIGRNNYKMKIDRFDKKNIAANSDFEIIFKDNTKRLTFISHLRKVIIDEFGFLILSIDRKPSFYGISSDSELGVEDPRIVKIDDKYVMTYVSLSRNENISTSIAFSKDLKNWERKGIIFGEQDKDVVIFPEKIKGKYVAFDRPEGNFEFSLPHIWIAYSDDLLSWGNLKSINLFKKSDENYERVGPGCPPIKTDKGWLLIYHTVSKDKEIAYTYSGSVALFDLENPGKLLLKSEPIFLPKADYELKLYQEKRIVFPTGVVTDKNNKNLLIYSGGGDVVTSVRKNLSKESYGFIEKIKMKISIDLAYEKALECIKKCSTPHGLFASAGKKAYRGVWARDSSISLIGASLVESSEIKNVFKRSLNTLADFQSKLGQIPNAVYGFKSNKVKVDFESIDSSLWFILGEYIYKKRYGNELFNKHRMNIKKALTWLSYQDMEEDSLLEQLPTTDWQDAFPHRYGHTINTAALYYKVLSLVGERGKQKKLKFNVEKNGDKKLWNGDFYYSYRWKNHNKYKEIGDWFDSLGNLLSIVFDLADKNKSKKIISYIEKNKIDEPYPMRAIYPPIKKGSKYWQDYYLDCKAGTPSQYLNGGIWPYIGSFYVLALIKLKRFKEAEKELEKLAEANLKGNFPEWINPLNKKMYGGLQAWNAGTYILAYNSLKKKRVLI